MKSAATFVLKAAAFTIIFWIVWLFALRPLLYDNVDDASSKASQAADDALRQRAAQQQDEFERQLKKSIEYLKRQEELQDRWEKVIERWEKSAPDRKP